MLISNVIRSPDGSLAMLSIGVVRSSMAAASYFAKDN